MRAYLERRADTPATCAVLLRRRAFEAVSGFEVSFLDLYEDQAFFFKLLLVEAAYVEGRAWDRYRRHPAALCEARIRTGEHSDDYSVTAPRRRFLEWLVRHLQETGVDDRRIWRLLKRELRPYEHPVPHRIARVLRSAVRSLTPRQARRIARRARDRLRSLREQRRGRSTKSQGGARADTR